MMVQQDLWVTAVTRAKKLVIRVGTRKAINIALDWRLNVDHQVWTFDIVNQAQ